MLHSPRIICMWIFYICCLFQHTQLPTVAALPFEYFDDRDTQQLVYDLETEQSKAKYDTRLLLSEQFVKQPPSSTANAEGTPSLSAFSSSSSSSSSPAPSSPVTGMPMAMPPGNATNSWSPTTAVTWPGDGHEEHEQDEDKDKTTTTDDDDLQPHERAASCFNGERKYTHGQKVPRFDPCEVCLCMDGEIFCWWEKCAKKPTPTVQPFNSRSSSEIQPTSMSTIAPTNSERPMRPPALSKEHGHTNTLARLSKVENENVQNSRSDGDAIFLDANHLNVMPGDVIAMDSLPTHKQSSMHIKKNKKKKQSPGHNGGGKTKSQLARRKKKKFLQYVGGDKQQQQKQKYHHHGHERNNNNNNNNDEDDNDNDDENENEENSEGEDERGQHEKHHHKMQEENILKAQEEHQQQHQQQRLEQRQQERQQQQQQQYHQHQAQQHPMEHHFGKQHEQQNTAIMHNHQHAYSPYAPAVSQQSSSTSKILNFPENLPSVLYYDYKTEEHQHHQHEHRQQHLKHQRQRLMQQQQQQQQQRLQQQQKHQHEDEQHKAEERLQHRKLELPERPSSIYTDYERAPGTISEVTADSWPSLSSSSSSSSSPAPQNAATNEINKNSGGGDGDNDDDTRDETETDADILPEPPTKKPKITVTSVAAPTPTTTPPTTTTTTTATPEMMTGTSTISTASKKTTTKSSSSLLLSHLTDINAAIVAGHTNWLGDNINKLAAAAAANTMMQHATAMPPANIAGQEEVRLSGRDNEDDDDADADDDAFHRWLTSTETNNNNTNSNNAGRNSDADADSDALQTMEYIDLSQATTNSMGGSSAGVNDGSTQQQSNTPHAVLMRQQQQQQQQQNRTSASNGGHLLNNNATSNDYSSEFNGSVVNIDITLATTSDLQQSPPPPPQSQQQQQQQKLNQQQQHEQHWLPSQSSPMPAAAAAMPDINDEQIPKESIILEADLITNPGKATDSDGSQDIDNNAAHSRTLPVASRIGMMMTTMRTTTTTTKPTSSMGATLTSSNPERHCNVMGTLYRIGEVLPQDTGNCLQCVCIDGSSSAAALTGDDDTPRVTCSPHNCPPLVLPDLFDATGY